VNAEEITAQITPKTTENLYTITRFKYYNPHETDSIYYSVMIRNESGDIEAKYLFEENQLKECLSSGCSTNLSETCNNFIYDKLIRPLQEAANSESVLKIILAGYLHRVNLSAINNPNTEQYLFDERNITITTEVSNNKSKTYTDNSYFLVGGVDYGKPVSDKDDDSNIISQQLLAMRSGISDNWDYLPFEENIKEVLSKGNSPRIVHFATHGFFMEDGEDYDYLKLFDNPMTRSGLILAGANDSWSNYGETGILTALEIQNFNLRNTELVVLSACDSGLGDVIGSEGVFGLQRAFKIAGADNIIMSLCEISDEVTSEFMIHFYKQYLSENMTIREAFDNTQSFIKSKYPDPSIWAAYILLE